jgi:hypothetical protein
VTTDPFADPDTAAADESGDFLTNEELIGRHVIIVPKTLETIKGEGAWPDGREKTDYDRVTSDIIVLDGRRNPKIKQFPHLERDKYVSNRSIVAELRKYVGTGQPVLGYWTQVNRGFFLEPADSDVRSAPATTAAWERYQAANRELVVKPVPSAPQADKPPF